MTEVFPPAIGGSAVLFGNIYRRISAYPVTVVTEEPNCGSETADVGMIGQRIRADSWGITSVPSLQRYFSLSARLKRECGRQEAVVHCGRALPEGLGALLARRMRGGAPYLCWTHGEELTYAKRSRELGFLQARVHRSASLVIANSHNTASGLEAIGVPKSKIRVVHPGVDAARFQRADGARDIRARFAAPEDVLLLTVARLEHRKGHDSAIRTVALLAGEGMRLQYVIAGTGDELDRLQRLARELRVVDRIHFVGSVPDDELPDYYAAADVFLHPNRRESSGEEEGFGIVFLEAAAAGLPAIGGRSGGVQEAVQHGVTGLLVDADNPGELADAVRTLAASSAFRRELGQAGRTRILREFTWDRAAEQVEAIHAELATCA